MGFGSGEPEHVPSWSKYLKVPLVEVFQVGEQQVNCHAANVLFFFLERFGIGGDVQGLVSVQSSILAPPRPQLK